VFFLLALGKSGRLREGFIGAYFPCRAASWANLTFVCLRLRCRQVGHIFGDYPRYRLPQGAY
jgi:hypothetical protein